MTSLNVLITAASRRVPLIRAFQRAIRDLRVPGSVFVTDVNALSPGVHVADDAFLVPLATDPGYVDAIESICRGERVRLLVPTIDDELPLFGAARTRFGNIGTQVVASDLLAAEICNDKFLTCRYLASRGLAAADSFLPNSLPPRSPFRCSSSPEPGGAAWVRSL